LYIKRLKETGNYNRYSADKPRVNRFKEFLQEKDVAFSDMSVGLLERFKVYLKSTRNISDRTIINHLVVIRSVFSQAIKEGATDERYYPFGKGKIAIKFPETTKVGISQKDVRKLEKVKLRDPAHDHARNLWLVSYYFAGMRISDVLRLRWSDFQDMRLHYTMGKNNKAGSLKTPEKALRIIAKYEKHKEQTDDFVFADLKTLPDLKDDFNVQRKIASATNRHDKLLRLHVAPAAKISAKLTMHIARHTFATIAGDKIPIQMLQKLYRHSNVTTTIGYQASFIHKDADDALAAVIGS
jgi:integrase